MDEAAVLAEFVRRHPFAALVSAADGAPAASHLPLLLEAGGARGRLIGHLARGSTQARSWGGGARALAIFRGPHAYVSPAWYAERPAVPTWNYAVAHVEGRVRAIEDAAWLERLLDLLLARFEPARAGAEDAAGREHRRALLPGIVGLELEIERVEFRFKLGQNRSRADRAGAAAALLASAEQAERDTGALMLEALDS